MLELINELCDIDENLDWRYKRISATDEWERDNGTHIYKIQVDFADLKNISIITTKTNNSTARVQRELGNCHNNLSNSNVLSKIKQALKL